MLMSDPCFQFGGPGPEPHPATVVNVRSHKLRLCCAASATLELLWVLVVKTSKEEGLITTLRTLPETSDVPVQVEVKRRQHAQVLYENSPACRRKTGWLQSRAVDGEQIYERMLGVFQSCLPDGNANSR
jgi:hypothetical protein